MTPHERKLLIALLAIFVVGAFVRQWRRGNQPPVSASPSLAPSQS